MDELKLIKEKIKKEKEIIKKCEKNQQTPVNQKNCDAAMFALNLILHFVKELEEERND